MKYEVLHKAMVEAYKSNQKERKNFISGFLAQIQKAAIDKGCREDISEELVNAELLKIKKQVQEQITTCPDSRPELKERFTHEMEVLNEFVPQVITDSETIRKAIIEIVGNEIVDKRQRGLVMKSIKASGVLYDMAVVNKVLYDMLAQ